MNREERWRDVFDHYPADVVIATAAYYDGCNHHFFGPYVHDCLIGVLHRQLAAHLGRSRRPGMPVTMVAVRDYRLLTGKRMSYRSMRAVITAWDHGQQRDLMVAFRSYAAEKRHQRAALQRAAILAERQREITPLYTIGGPPAFAVTPVGQARPLSVVAKARRLVGV